MNTITSLFQQAQLAEAAYANFFDNSGNLITTNAGLVTALTDSKFSQAQATAFTNEWSVVDQYTAPSFLGLTGSGFSATVFKNKVGQYSFAIRGSTALNDFKSDAQLITTDGVAVSQLVDMYNYWQRLTHLGVYQAATLTTQYAASGFLSLLYAGSAADVPASLAALFGGATSVSSYDVARAVLLSNGYVVEGRTVYQVGFDLSTNVYTDSRQWGSNTLAGQSVSVDGHSLGGHLAMAFSRLFPSATSDVTAINGLGFKVADANVNSLFTQLGGVPGFDAGKIENVYGMAGAEFASMNNGVLQQPGAWDGIYIEDGSLLSAQIGGHSATQMTDSLAVYKLFAQLDPALNTSTAGINTITAILKAESNVAANSLESAMTGLGKLFNVPGAVVTGNAFDTNRDLLYTAIAGFDSIVNAPFAVAPTIQSLTGMDAATLAANAQADPSSSSGQGIAYRYALQELNPFVAVGMNYSGFDVNGELDLYNAATHTGDLTDQYLVDRAAFLVNKVLANTNDSVINGAGYVQSNGALQHFQDDSSVIPTQVFVAPSNIGYTNDDFQHIHFGSTQNDTITGYAKDDHLYGMGGNDTLTGGKGNDYLEGGTGNDTYVYNKGDGFDTILDTDGNGKILVDGAQLNGGAQFGDTRVHKDSNGHTYVDVSGAGNSVGGLVIDGNLFVQDWQAGNLGITMTGPAAEAVPQATILGTPNDDDINLSLTNVTNDVIDAGAGQDHVFAGMGNDVIIGGTGSDALDGFGGNDRIYADNFISVADAITLGNSQTGTGLRGDALSGDSGNDTLVGSAGNDILAGGAGADLLIKYGTQGDTDTLVSDDLCKCIYLENLSVLLGVEIVMTCDNGVHDARCEFVFGRENREAENDDAANAWGSQHENPSTAAEANCEIWIVVDDGGEHECLFEKLERGSAVA